MKSIYRLLLLFGVDPIKFYHTIKGLKKYFKDFKLLKSERNGNTLFTLKSNYPIINEWNDQAGDARGHYFHQDLFVSQLIYTSNPENHIDIGSRIDGFVAHVASFRNIKILDIRDVEINHKNISFMKADLMNIQSTLLNSVDSISCLHALEHFGLGRYGDPIDYFGYLKGFENITSILKKGGIFYFSVPIGPQRIEFNAHRIFSMKYLISLISKYYIIKSFSYVDDNDKFSPNALLSEENINNNFGCNYGCGIFELLKN